MEGQAKIRKTELNFKGLLKSCAKIQKILQNTLILIYKKCTGNSLDSKKKRNWVLVVFLKNCHLKLFFPSKEINQ